LVDERGGGGVSSGRVGERAGELWTLNWHRDYDIHGPWTIAGFGGNMAACAAAWDAAAPWMKHMPEY